MIWLIGAGPMAIEYGRVLQALGHKFICITRSQTSATSFVSQFDQQVFAGGLEQFLNTSPLCPSHAIVATGIETLSPLTSLLICYGVKSVLVEKPGGMGLENIIHLAELSKKAANSLFVAYNRRFYASVIKAEELIKKDGNISSMNYEITEWSHIIEGLKQSPEIKSKCFIANTSHVVDLAFYLGGRPKQLSCFTADKTSWHPESANFAGAGVTEKKALFVYHGNWNAPGRWSLEVLTRKHRFIFRPMEKLQIQRIGSVAIEEVDIDLHYDNEFKPGLYKQTEAFLNNDTIKLCSISEHLLNMDIYYRMAGYECNDGMND